MGGTSTDVSHYDGEYERAFETEVAGRAHARADDADQHRGRRRRLDPALRAGPLPGRAAVGRGAARPRLLPPGRPARRHRRQPHGRQARCRSTSRSIFGAKPRPAARRRGGACRLRRPCRRDRRRPQRPRRSPTGSSASRSQNMANADQEDLGRSAATTSPNTSLNCFGGAGGQHACLVADTLGIRTVLIHPYSGVLSAYGMGLADIRATRNRAVMKPVDADLDLAADEHALETAAARRGAPAGRRRRRHRASSSAPTSATRAPTRRSRSPSSRPRPTDAGRGRCSAPPR